MPTDRFSIDSVVIDDKVINFTMNSELLASKLQAYHFTFTPDYDRLSTYRQTGAVVTINTTSLLRPVIRVPIKYAIEPIIRVIPERLSFIADRKGAIVTQELQLVSDKGASFDASIENIPEGWKAVVKEGSGRGEKIIQFHIPPTKKAQNKSISKSQAFTKWNCDIEIDRIFNITLIECHFRRSRLAASVPTVLS